MAIEEAVRAHIVGLTTDVVVAYIVGNPLYAAVEEACIQSYVAGSKKDRTYRIATNEQREEFDAEFNKRPDRTPEALREYLAKYYDWEFSSLSKIEIDLSDLCRLASSFFELNEAQEKGILDLYKPSVEYRQATDGLVRTTVAVVELKGLGVVEDAYAGSVKGTFSRASYQTFLIVAIIAALLGFRGVAGTATWIAKVVFVVFLVLFLFSMFRTMVP
jgi:uncharacterized membrane protein YtjA (UPF0391 family)